MPWIYFGFNLYVKNGTERIKVITSEPWCKTVDMKKNSIKSNELDLNLFVCMKVIRSDLKTDKKLKIPTELRTTTSHFDYSMTSNVFWILSRKPVNLHSKLHVFSYRILTFNLSLSIKIQTRFDLTYTRIWPVFDLDSGWLGENAVSDRQSFKINNFWSCTTCLFPCWSWLWFYFWNQMFYLNAKWDVILVEQKFKL